MRVSKDHRSRKKDKNGSNDAKHVPLNVSTKSRRHKFMQLYSTSSGTLNSRFSKIMNKKKSPKKVMVKKFFKKLNTSKKAKSKRVVKEMTEEEHKTARRFQEQFKVPLWKIFLLCIMTLLIGG